MEEIPLSLDALPIEVLHRIFDYLDTETILLALRYVCQRCYQMSNTYAQYKLDFTTIPKRRFQIICHRIDPTSVVSLTLSDDHHTPGQIDLFLRLLDIRQFTRLRSLMLKMIGKSDLPRILADLPLSSLRSLSIIRQKYDFDRTNPIQVNLSTIIGQSKLHTLELDIWYEMLDVIVWAEQCCVEKLIVSNNISVNLYCQLLCRLPLLRICILENLELAEMDDITSRFYSHSMKSLTIKSRCMRMHELEPLLSLTPSIEHLQLIGKTDPDDLLFDGDRWRNFIQTKLPDLERLEFDFVSVFHLSSSGRKLHSFLESYRTPFWQEEKRWFFTCTYVQDPPLLRLCSIPMFQSYVHHNPREVVLSTLITIDEALPLRASVRHLSLKATELVSVMGKPDRCLFPKVDTLTFHLDHRGSAETLKMLPFFVDLTQLAALTLRFDFERLSKPETTQLLTDLFTQLSHIDSLSLLDEWSRHIGIPGVKMPYSILPNRLKHFQTNFIDINDLQHLLLRLPHLYSLGMVSCDPISRCPKIIDGLTNQGFDFTYKRTISSLYMWLK